MAKKKFKETKLGIFLTDKAPNILDSIGNVLPDKGVLGIVKNLIDSDDGMSPLQKMEALNLVREHEKELEKQVSERWTSDMTSDSWLSKNVRPLTLVYLLFVMTILVIGDSLEGFLSVGIAWVNLIESLLITVFIAYFGSRGFEKYNKIKRE